MPPFIEDLDPPPDPVRCCEQLDGLPYRLFLDSAVAGAPLQDGWAYISSGTWSLVGVELNAPLINAETARHNFTNEGGASGTMRFLKNVMEQLQVYMDPKAKTTIRSLFTEGYPG